MEKTDAFQNAHVKTKRRFVISPSKRWLFLNDGTYKIMIMVVQENSFGIYNHEDILIFDAHEGERDSNWYGKWPGAVRPKLNWTTEFINSTDKIGFL